MADLIIQPKNDDHLKLNNDAGTTILELANDESKLRLAQNNISASDGTTAITTSGANVTLAGTANNIGTVTSGTFNGTIGSSATWTSIDNGDIPKLKVDAFGEYTDVSIDAGVSHGIHTMSFSGETILVSVSVSSSSSTNYLYGIALAKFASGGSIEVNTFGSSKFTLTASGTTVNIVNNDSVTRTARIRKIHLTSGSN